MGEAIKGPTVADYEDERTAAHAQRAREAVTVTLPRKDAEWLYEQVGKLTRTGFWLAPAEEWEVSREGYEALKRAVSS